MPDVQVNTRSLSYTVTGDGFPLLLAPGQRGTSTVWAQCLPLLGELCRAITYEYGAAVSTQTAPGLPAAMALADDVEALCQRLDLERLYLASLTPAWPMALSFARRFPQRLEALLLISLPGTSPELSPSHRPPPGSATGTDEALWHEPLPAISAPTLLLVSDQDSSPLPSTETLATRLPHCTQVSLPAAHFSPHTAELSLPVGHAMMHFLIQRERQRNLVRGASFLL